MFARTFTRMSSCISVSWPSFRTTSAKSSGIITIFSYPRQPACSSGFLLSMLLFDASEAFKLGGSSRWAAAKVPFILRFSGRLSEVDPSDLFAGFARFLISGIGYMLSYFCLYF